MTGVQETSCKLCLKTVTVKGFEVIDDVTRDTLDVLLLKLKFDAEGKEFICNVCRRKLNAAFEFKSTCLKTHYTIIPYVDCEKMLQLDIRDVYTKEKTSESVHISDGQKICRLCMEPVESELRCICQEELEAIEKLAPEMNINIIKDPVVCKECFASVCTHNSFLKNCLEVQEEIRGISNNAATESLIDTSPSYLFVKTENQDKEFDINQMEMSIKAESIDIKSEDEESSDSLLQSSNSDLFEKSVRRDAEEDGCKHENRSTNECMNEYETENKKFFQKHRLRHKDSSDTSMHRCGSYDYKTSHRCELAKCQVKHKSASEGDYKIKNTALPNKDTSQLPKYKCDGCTYQSENKTHFTRHKLVHKHPSQAKMYGCNDCDYKTKFHNCIKRHQLKHKDPSQVQMYRCKDCDYETRYKSDMKQHQLKHKDPSQVQMYRCKDCVFCGNLNE
ncbi:zinc finger protein 836-like [Anoplophora glabripennis]|uniref:zinc finger protein 836-like n=1 Tax=Anoplophora glabripennis TaxID=217634 RepID=UPI00087481BE|nr:zinc finger protein 836-like [Anoplophora glabripennis]